MNSLGCLSSGNIWCSDNIRIGNKQRWNFQKQPHSIDALKRVIIAFENSSVGICNYGCTEALLKLSGPHVPTSTTKIVVGYEQYRCNSWLVAQVSKSKKGLFAQMNIVKPRECIILSTFNNQNGVQNLWK